MTRPARYARAPFSLLAVLASLMLAAPAQAWVEQAVKSDSVTLDLDHDGRALVTHEILLWVRGGPLPSISVEPVDEDAELESGATATIAQSGHAAGFPMPLETSKDGAKVTLTVVGAKGLRTGTHLIRFSYRASLAAGTHLSSTALGTSLRWSGPSFADGIDSEKVVFRLPSATTPPRLGVEDSGTLAENVADDNGGVFLSTFRRAADKDELEVVRPHVAKNEVVSWRIRVDPAVFNVAASAAPAEAPVPAVVVPRAHLTPVARSPWWIAVVALAFAFGGIVALKARWVTEAYRARRATPRPLLRAPTWMRAILACALVLGASALVVVNAPALAAVSLVLGLVAAAHLPPRLSTPLRGPGEWTPLEPAVAFAEEETVKTPGRFVDAGTPIGFALFVSLLSLFVAAALTTMRHSEYHGLCVALGSALLFPIFCTGRAGELPPDPVRAPADLLDWLMTEFSKDGLVATNPIGRMPLGRTEPDEIRLRVLPKRPVNGFVAIEVGLDVHQGALGLLSLPFVLVRVLDGTDAAEALPKGLFWTRGRSADERVAVLRPKISTRRMTALLVRDVSNRLSISSAPGRRQSGPTSAARSKGKGSTASKPATTSSPAHAT